MTRPLDVDVLVRDGDKPAAGFRVAVMRHPWEAPVGGVLRTDDEGRACFPDLEVGDATVVAVNDDGSKFGEISVRLPRLLPGPVALPVAAQRKTTILVVDDDTRAPISGAVFEDEWFVSLWGDLLPPIEPTDEEGRTDAPAGVLPSHWSVKARGYPRLPERSGLGFCKGDSDGEYVLFIPPPRTLRFPIVEGNDSIPPAGTRVRIARAPWDRHDESDPPPPEEGVIEGADLVIAGVGAETFEALAECPDGRQSLLHADHRFPGAKPPEPVAFSLPWTVEVTLRRADGSPVSGVPVCLSGEGGNIFGQLSPTLRTDGEGRVTFTGPWPAEVHIWMLRHKWSAGLTGGIIRGGTARFQTCLGTVDLDPRGEGAGQERRVRFDAAIEEEIEPSDPPPTDADPDSTGTLLARLLVPSGEDVVPYFERWSAKTGDWDEVHGFSDERSREPGPDGICRFEGIDPGTYRLREGGTGLLSGTVEVQSGGTALLVFDLRRLGLVEGRVEVPAGEDPGHAQVVYEAEGLKTRYLEVTGAGEFSMRLPGDRPVTLQVRHPLLAPDPGRGSVRLRDSRSDVVLRLVSAPRFSLRLEPVPEINIFHESLGLLVIKGEPGTGPATSPPIVYERESGVVRSGGTPPGLWTLWVDAPHFAPVVLRGVLLGTGETELGTVPLLRGGSVRIRSRQGEGGGGRSLKARAVHLGEPPYERHANGEEEFVLDGLGPGRFRVTVEDRMTHDRSTDAEGVIESDGRSEALLEVAFP